MRLLVNRKLPGIFFEISVQINIKLQEKINKDSDKDRPINVVNALLSHANLYVYIYIYKENIE